jgi:hypothetical protein
MDELVWSIQPKHSAEERKLLVTLLPTLLKRLQSGIATTSMSDTQKSGFFSALVKCHAAAVKAGLQTKHPSTSAEHATPALNPVGGLDDNLDDEEIEDETPMLLDPSEIADELATRLSDGVNDIEEIAPS